MGRLAVSTSEQGKGHGGYLLAHAVARCLALRGQLGVRVLPVDTLHSKAARFYRAYGFRETTTNAPTLYLPLGKPQVHRAPTRPVAWQYLRRRHPQGWQPAMFPSH